MAFAARVPLPPGLDLLPPPGLETADECPRLEMPTLLTSRPFSRGVGRDSKLGQAPCAPQQLDGYPMYVHVRNTFIETSAEPSGLLDGFFEERQVRTCPASHIGRLKNLFEEAECDQDNRKGSRPPSPGSDSTASTNGPLQRMVLSLADSLSPQRKAAQAKLADADMITAKAVPPPPPMAVAPGSAELPSIGSAGHATGRCKPCAFFHAAGCENGPSCAFCHLCESDERKRRRKEKLQARRLAHRLRKARREGEVQME